MLNNLKYCQNVVMSSVECEDSANINIHTHIYLNIMRKMLWDFNIWQKDTEIVA